MGHGGSPGTKLGVTITIWLRQCSCVCLSRVANRNLSARFGGSASRLAPDGSEGAEGGERREKFDENKSSGIWSR